MKSKITLLMVLAVCLSNAIAQSYVTNHLYGGGTNGAHAIYFPRGPLFGTTTNFVRDIQVTNLVIENTAKVQTDRDEHSFVTVTSEGVTNFVNALVSSGEFCRIKGHAWGDHLHLTLEYAPTRIGCRECQVCGRHEERYASDWK